MANFKVTVNKKEFTVDYREPTGLGDDAWSKMVAGEGSEMVTVELPKVVADNVNTLAVKDWRIAVQAYIRNASPAPQNSAQAQSLADAYRYGAGGGGRVVEVKVVDVSALAAAGVPLNAKQVKELLESGHKVVGVSQELLDEVRKLDQKA